MIATQPPEAALAWAVENAGPGASIQAVRRLAGGTHAATHLLRMSQPDREMVLRRFPPGDHAAAQEASVLATLDGLDGWAPRLIDADPDGSRFGEPAILITRLPGHADIVSIPPRVSAAQLGRVLALIHASPIDRYIGLPDGMRAIAASSAGPIPAATILADRYPRLAAQPPVLTHYDYWSGNVLWESDTLVGVVDWSGASRAPRGFDVSWCRLDLALLHGRAAAATFLAAYEEAAAKPVPEMVLWDLFAVTNSHHAVETWLPNYRDLGRTELTAADLRERHTAWTQECLRRYWNAARMEHRRLPGAE